MVRSGGRGVCPVLHNACRRAPFTLEYRSRQ